MENLGLTQEYEDDVVLYSLTFLFVSKEVTIRICPIVTDGAVQKSLS